MLCEVIWSCASFVRGCTTTKYTQKPAAAINDNKEGGNYRVRGKVIKSCELSRVKPVQRIKSTCIVFIYSKFTLRFEYKSVWLWLVLEVADMLDYRNRIQADNFQAWLTQQSQVWSMSRAKMGWEEPMRVRVKPAGSAHHCYMSARWFQQYEPDNTSKSLNFKNFTVGELTLSRT